MGTAAVSPESVTVSGSVEQVSQVAKVVAILEDENLDERFAGDLPLTLLDREGNPLTDLDVTLSADSRLCGGSCGGAEGCGSDGQCDSWRRSHSG